MWAATAFAVELEHGYHPARRSHLLVEDAGWVVIVSGAALAIPFVVVVTRASQKRWFRTLGAMTGPALATAYWYAPLAVFLAWIVAAEVSGSADGAGGRAHHRVGYPRGSSRRRSKA